MKAPERCVYCNGDDPDCGFCELGVPLDTQEDWDRTWRPILRIQCRCVWDSGRCSNDATKEDGLCNWCGVRTAEDVKDDPNALWGPDGEFLGYGGARQPHVNPWLTPDACWMSNSGRTLA